MVASRAARERKAATEAGPLAKVKIELDADNQFAYKISCSSCVVRGHLNWSAYRSGGDNGYMAAMDRWIFHLVEKHPGSEAPCLAYLAAAQQRLHERREGQGQERDPHVLAAGQAPTPFTADEIRDATTVGKTLRRLVEVAGREPYLRISRYVDCDEAGATLERSEFSLDGTPLDEPETDRVTWLDLQAHASFPAEATTIESERIETGLGELDCLRYTVREGATEKLLWFATDLPGMPVRMETRVDGELVMTVSAVA